MAFPIPMKTDGPGVSESAILQGSCQHSVRVDAHGEASGGPLTPGYLTPLHREILSPRVCKTSQLIRLCGLISRLWNLKTAETSSVGHSPQARLQSYQGHRSA
ncbi:unnamed protein product [Lota lota]